MSHFACHVQRWLHRLKCHQSGLTNLVIVQSLHDLNDEYRRMTNIKFDQLTFLVHFYLENEYLHAIIHLIWIFSFLNLPVGNSTWTFIAYRTRETKHSWINAISERQPGWCLTGHCRERPGTVFTSNSHILTFPTAVHLRMSIYMTL